MQKTSLFSGYFCKINGNFRVELIYLFIYFYFRTGCGSLTAIGQYKQFAEIQLCSLDLFYGRPVKTNWSPGMFFLRFNGDRLIDVSKVLFTLLEKSQSFNSTFSGSNTDYEKASSTLDFWHWATTSDSPGRVSLTSVSQGKRSSLSEYQGWVSLTYPRDGCGHHQIPRDGCHEHHILRGGGRHHQNQRRVGVINIKFPEGPQHQLCRGGCCQHLNFGVFA